MPIWVGTNKLSTSSNANNFVGTAKTQTIYVDTNKVWERSDPAPVVLFSIPGVIVDPNERYSYCVFQLELPANILTTYSSLIIYYMFSYGEVVDGEVRESWGGVDFEVSSYGVTTDSQQWVEAELINSNDGDMLNLNTIAIGPGWGFSALPAMYRVIGMS